MTTDFLQLHAVLGKEHFALLLKILINSLTDVYLVT